jgi:hypothetical protein
VVIIPSYLSQKSSENSTHVCLGTAANRSNVQLDSMHWIAINQRCRALSIADDVISSTFILYIITKNNAMLLLCKQHILLLMSLGCNQTIALLATVVRINGDRIM